MMLGVTQADGQPRCPSWHRYCHLPTVAASCVPRDDQSHLTGARLCLSAALTFPFFLLSVWGPLQDTVLDSATGQPLLFLSVLVSLLP